jgi:predicted nucleic acid-binding Zn ribbon protein
MPRHSEHRDVSPEAARALVGASQVASRACPICRAALQGRQTSCSGKCRAALSRQRQAETREARDREVAHLLRAALAKLEGP